MPSESQLLYFHLVLRADDDGVVELYPVMRLLGVAPDNCKVLLAKEYIKQLNEEQVVVILDWLEHNKIRADRKVDSVYKHLLPPEIKTIAPKPRSDVEDNSKRLGGPSTDGISKDKLSQDKLNLSAEAELLNNKNETMFGYDENKSYELPTLDIETGELSSSRKKETAPSDKLRTYFYEQCFLHLKTRPKESPARDRTIAKSAINTPLTKQQTKDLIAEWFASGKEAQDLIQITQCFSTVNINKFLANHTSHE